MHDWWRAATWDTDDRAPIRHQKDLLMNRPTRFALAPTCSLAALSVASLLAAFAGPAAAQGVVRSVHDDWQIRCETPPGAQNEQCALFQSVVAEDRANVGITVLVLKTADQKSRLMRIQAPLGVLLPAGLGLKIDQVDVGRAGFVRCLPKGCYAEVVMRSEEHTSELQSLRHLVCR